MERWNTRTLHDKIQGMLYERAARSKRPDKLIAAELRMLREDDNLSPDLVFRDPLPRRARCAAEGVGDLIWEGEGLEGRRWRVLSIGA